MVLAQPATMDNKTVIEMKKSGVSEDLILKAIRSAPEAHFTFYVDDFDAFAKGKLGPVILKAMFERSKQASTPVVDPRASAKPGEASVSKKESIKRATDPPASKRRATAPSTAASAVKQQAAFPASDAPEQGRHATTPASDTPQPNQQVMAPANDTPTPKLRPAPARSASSPGKKVKIHGYVTEVRSQTSFEVDDYRVMRDQTLEIDVEKEGDDSEDLPKQIRVGTEVEIKGEFDPTTMELHARSLKIFPSDLRKLRPRTALVENMPALTRSGESWRGTFRVDGQLLLVDEKTEVRIVPNNTQKKRIKEAEKARKAAAKTGAKDIEAEAEDVAVTRLDDIHRNMFVSYSGRRLEDGQIQATKLVFTDNEFTKGESRLWKSLNPKIKGFRTGSPGEIRVAGMKLKTIPDAELQKYIQDFGLRLVPAAQRDLGVGAENKIPFQFHLVRRNDPNAFATANGVVCVHSSLLSTVENEAQLAFVLAHEIAHATQEHTRRQMEFHRKERLALAIGAAVAQAYGKYNVSDMLKLTEAAIINGYSRYLENQADRLGMEYMINAGFDPREAPRAWKSLSLKMGDRPTNFFWSNHDNNTTRRSYLMSELRNNYSGVDFTAKLKDSEQFETMRTRLQEAYSGKKRAKGRH